MLDRHTIRCLRLEKERLLLCIVVIHFLVYLTDVRLSNKKVSAMGCNTLHFVDTQIQRLSSVPV